MRTLFHVVMVTVAVTLLTAQGCATKRQTGAVAGGAIGTAAGAAVGDNQSAVIGGLLGVIVGSEIGRHMDEQDRRRANYALEKNSTGETSTWTNPDTGERYAVTPTNTYSRSGSPCREFVLTRTAPDGHDYDSHETACRQSDGTWKVIS